MLKIRSTLLILFICIMCCKYVTAQNTFAEVIDQELYLSERSVVNGTVWTNSFRYQGNRFCGSKSWKKGELTIAGKKYSNLLINYDILDDQVLLYDEAEGSGKYIQLNKTQIDSFNFSEDGSVRQFVSAELDPSEEKEICEVLFQGKVSYYVRHKKAIKKQIVKTETGKTYAGILYDNNTHYLKTDSGTSTFRNKKKLLELLGNDKTLQKFIRKRGLTIKTRYPNDIVELLGYNETLNSAN